MSIVLKIFRFIGFTLLCIFSGSLLGISGLFGIISIRCVYDYLITHCPELMSLTIVFIISIVGVTLSIWLFGICFNKKWWK